MNPFLEVSVPSLDVIIRGADDSFVFEFTAFLEFKVLMSSMKLDVVSIRKEKLTTLMANLGLANLGSKGYDCQASNLLYSSCFFLKYLSLGFFS